MFLPTIAYGLLLIGEVVIPKCNDERLTFDLFAAEPELVTPTAITVDDKGNPLVIECHTHFRPAGYDGPPADRIRRFEDTNGDGKADRISTFWEGSTATMGIGRHPKNGWTYVATRDHVFRLKDTDGNGGADLNEPLVSLESKDKYPHSGISGFAFDADGNVFFGLGENHAEPFRMKGTDGTVLSGIEGGHVYQMKPDGSKLQRVSIGCWNPFHLTFDPLGRLFVVDNDPDSLPPCRLLHIVQGGDYGYKYRNGRKGTHPFTAWNGELPGTLPMVAGTGEAPSGIWACGMGDKLPGDYHGDLLVTSWGDHRIERYRLKPRGASFSAERIDLIKGDENFRPVGITAGGEGAIYITDWVDKSYELHKKGRIWRLMTVKGDSNKPLEVTAAKNSEEQHAELLRSKSDGSDLWKQCDSADPFIAQAARQGLKRIEGVRSSVDLKPLSPGGRLATILVLQDLGGDAAIARLPEFLADPDPAVRFAAMRWIGEERLNSQREQLAKALVAGPVTARVFSAFLAASEKLDRPPRKDNDEWTLEQYAVASLTDSRTPPEAMRWALRSVRPDHPAINGAMILRWMAGDDPAMRIEAVRTLRESRLSERNDMLLRLAEEATQSSLLRAEALVGFLPNNNAETARLVKLACGGDRAIGDEALRSLRGVSLGDEARSQLTALAATASPSSALIARILEPEANADLPEASDTPAWMKLLDGPADAAAGERIFHNAKSAACLRCHQMEGRGSTIGPDLSATAKALSRERLIDSILQPSKEIAPQFVTWGIETTDGQALIGMLVGEGLNAEQFFADSQGKRFTLKPSQIESRKQLATSIMPEGLAKQMTVQELRNLLAYLQK